MSAELKLELLELLDLEPLDRVLSLELRCFFLSTGSAGEKTIFSVMGPVCLVSRTSPAPPSGP